MRGAAGAGAGGRSSSTAMTASVASAAPAITLCWIARRRAAPTTPASTSPGRYGLSSGHRRAPSSTSIDCFPGGETFALHAAFGDHHAAVGASQPRHRAQLVHRRHADAITAPVLAGHQAGAMLGLHHEIGAGQAVLRQLGRLPSALILQNAQYHGGKIAPMHGGQRTYAFVHFTCASSHQPEISTHRQPEQQCSQRRQNPGRHKHQAMARITRRWSRRILRERFVNGSLAAISRAVIQIERPASPKP